MIMGGEEAADADLGMALFKTKVITTMNAANPANPVPTTHLMMSTEFLCMSVLSSATSAFVISVGKMVSS